MKEIILTLLAIFAFGALYCAVSEYIYRIKSRAWSRQNRLLQRARHFEDLATKHRREVNDLLAELSEIKTKNQR
jgi:hypothetical protein